MMNFHHNVKYSSIDEHHPNDGISITIINLHINDEFSIQ